MAVTLDNKTIKVSIVTPKRTIKLDKVGLRGSPGPSVYDVWLEQPGNAGKTEAEFFTWLSNSQISKIQPLLDQAITARNAAQTAATASAASAVSAATSKTDADTSKTNAQTAATAAASASVAAGAARDSALAEAGNAAGYANLANQSLTAALAAKVVAEDAATAASTSAIAAATARDVSIAAKTAAELAASDATTAKLAAQAAKTTAETKASEAETAHAAAVIAKTAAETAATSAGTSATAANNAKTAAETALNTATQKAADAETARVASVAAQGVATQKAADAETARLAAVAAQDDAIAKAATATTQAGLAATAKAAAETARDVAIAARDTAQGYRDTTLGYRDSALGYRDQAQTYRNEAQTFRDQAASIVGGDFLSQTEADTLYRRLDTMVPLNQVNGLQTALDTKLASADFNTLGDARYRRLSVALTITDITNLQSSLDAKANLAGATFSGKVTTSASVVGGAGFNLPSGTSPSAPINGDLWSDISSGGILRIRRNNTTAALYDSVSMPAMSQAIAEAGTDTSLMAISALTMRQGIDAAIGSQKNAANGLAPLDVNGKIPLSNLPEAVLGALKYQGTWNAATNSPAIPAADAGNLGWYRVINTDGTTNIGGITDWKIGDWIVSNGISWDKVDSSDQVTSVNGQQGAVVLTKTSVGLANVDNTSDANKPVSTATQTALDGKQGLNTKLTAISGVTAANDTLFYFTGASAGAVTAFTSVARTLVGQTTQSAMLTAGLGLSSNGQSLVTAANYAAMRTLLGLVIGTDVQAYNAVLANLTNASANGQSLITAANYAAMRTALGLVPGTNVQAYNDNLAALAGLAGTTNKLFYFTGVGSMATSDLTAFGRSLIGAADAAAAKTLLGSSGSGMDIGDVFYSKRAAIPRCKPLDGSSYQVKAYPAGAQFFTWSALSFSGGSTYTGNAGNSGCLAYNAATGNYCAVDVGQSKTRYGTGGSLAVGTTTVIGPNKVASNDALFMLVSSNPAGYVWTGADGSVWTVKTSAGFAINAVASGPPNTWMVGGTAGQLKITVNDGTSWNTITSPFSGYQITSIAYSPTLALWIIATQDGKIGVYNGTSCVLVTSPFATAPIYQVSWLPEFGRFAAGAANGSLAFSNTDGVSWPSLVTATSFTSAWGANAIYTLKSGPGFLLIGGTITNGVMYSKDLSTFASITTGFSQIYDLVYDTTRFYALAFTGSATITAMMSLPTFTLPNVPNLKDASNADTGAKAFVCLE